uniref:Transposon TX1 uncharacterized n=1 Tax=Tanacetum cinerariifolium TaxID=118510 RepID=A0A6L2JUX8_TANCI|nr:transposon TX1 uncharacterized [Tanacetum cinerariifolium]
MNKAGTKISKLDHFLIYEDIVDALPDIQITALDCLWSDHTPILLHVSKLDFGPSSFKLYNSWLLQDSLMPQGANSSFFTLISKVINPIHISDFRPISLIGVQYKIIAKILTIRLFKVTDKIVNKKQSTFIAGRKILDGPLILSEFIDCLGFGSKWRSWIRACLHSSRGLILINGSPTSEFSIKRGLRRTGCASGSFSFTYLGLLIRSNMNLNSSWQILIYRFHKRLSSWRANLLSIGERLTLIKAVLDSLGIYYILIFKALELILKSLKRSRATLFGVDFKTPKS